MERRLWGGWQRLGASQRFAATAVAALLVIIAGALWTVARDTRVALYPAALRADQVAEVSEWLAAWGIAYVPTADNVRVDARSRDATLLRLAVVGVPHQHVTTSDEALSGVGALTPQSVIDAQTRQGLSGDLALALRGIDGVEDARVIIAPAQHGIYADEPSHDATASVWIMLRPGARLPRGAVASMRAFVASAVPGLSGSHVTLLDDHGVALRDGIDARDMNAVAPAAPKRSSSRWMWLYGALIALIPALVTALTMLVVLRMAGRPLLRFTGSMVRLALIERHRTTMPARAPGDVRRSLDGEPPYAAAAVISALPAATAAAVLDLYPADERAAIVRRLSRKASPLAHEVTNDIA